MTTQSVTTSTCRTFGNTQTDNRKGEGQSAPTNKYKSNPINQYTMKRTDLRAIMQLAWQFVKRNGIELAEALRKAWQVFKLKAAMAKGIVRFYFRKVDGTIREAYGTLKAELMPETKGNDNRKKNDSVQVYFDTEKQEFRCFKLANLVIL